MLKGERLSTSSSENLPKLTRNLSKNVPLSLTGMANFRPLQGLASICSLPLFLINPVL